MINPKGHGFHHAFCVFILALGRNKATTENIKETAATNPEVNPI